MSTGVGIHTHEQIIFVLCDTDHGIDIPAFIVAVKDDLFVWLKCGVHASEDAVIFGLEVCMKLAEISCHVHVVGVDGSLVLEHVLSVDLLVHFEAVAITITCLACALPK